MVVFWSRVSKLMIVVLHGSVLSMLLIAIINKSWIEKQTSLGTYHQGLWQSCVADVCMSIGSSGTAIKHESINIIRVSLVLGAMFGLLALVLTVRVDLKIVAIAAAVSCAFVTSGMAIYTNDTHSFISTVYRFQYDWAFMLGWICATSGLLSTIGTAVAACMLSRYTEMETLP